MKHRELKLHMTTKDYCALVDAAKKELRTVENEALYQLRKKHEESLGQKEKRNDD